MTDRIDIDGNRRIWAIVPVKKFSLAKQRLSSLLSESERSELMRTMLTDVLTSLRATPGLAGTLVLTSDWQAAEIAALFKAQVVHDEAAGGLNCAVQRGLDLLHKTGAGALIAPADIPFATADDYVQILDALRRSPVVLAPALSDGGTNVLAMRSASNVGPSFGEGSFVRHRTAAHAKGFQVSIVQSDGMGRDIDNIDDIIASTTMPRTSLTFALFDKLALMERIAITMRHLLPRGWSGVSVHGGPQNSN